MEKWFQKTMVSLTSTITVALILTFFIIFVTPLIFSSSRHVSLSFGNPINDGPKLRQLSFSIAQLRSSVTLDSSSNALVSSSNCSSVRRTFFSRKRMKKGGVEEGLARARAMISTSKRNRSVSFNATSAFIYRNPRAFYRN